jgi:hypothetical protein
VAKKQKFYTQTELIKERNWTKTKIDEWLKEPDMEKSNPHYKSASPMRLFLASRVHAQERNKRFKVWQERHLKAKENRVKSAKKSAEKRRRKLILFVGSLKIDIPHFESERELFQEAVEHYNALWSFRGKFDKCIVDPIEIVDRDFLKRISLNMLRHTTDQYEAVIEEMFGQTGKDDAYALLRERVTDLIFDKYPSLQY